MKTAKELFEITNEHQITVEKLVEGCEERANFGVRDFIHFGYVSVDNISTLANLGFRIEKHSGPIHEECYRISWE